ncbi:cwf21-domain-containing protein [Patellaria atrata CBS 101060]|uniref:Cwf21-domain-containing protein n=1 Tax=Patellaria atrata CBS 101060 TaxID=1346257 RepID=A0A9P4SD58_9PEZI|nr:cwf21-domain-containing protein [Patellaria atrata CBS 101060]
MSANVGLNTPRGSGTSGYVQRNLSHLKPRDATAPYPKDFDMLKHRQRQPDTEILEHDRKREIEVKVFELRDRLEDEGVDDDEIEDQCTALRKKLQAERKKGEGAKSGKAARGLKTHQVHELAAAKIEESERLRKALGIRADYEEGSHWKKQEERLKSNLVEKASAQRERSEEREREQRGKSEESEG